MLFLGKIQFNLISIQQTQVKDVSFLYHCMLCFCSMYPLASPSPGLPGTSGGLTGLWGVRFGEEGSSPSCYIFLLFPRLCPSCSSV